jgi:hypothetical protein
MQSQQPKPEKLLLIDEMTEKRPGEPGARRTAAALLERASEDVFDEGSERDSEVFVKDDDPESPAALERR